MIAAADIAIVTGDRAGQALPPLPFAHVVTLADEKVIDALRLRARRSLTGHHADTAGPASDRPGTPERLLKRVIDLVLTVPFALLTLPITLAAILAVRVLDPGRAIFIQQRIGKDGRPFGVYKIRTMYQDAGDRLDRCLAEDPALAEEWRTHFKLKQDPRILPVIGQILRKYSIDELPQLWNVLKGDMSLVGPRPFPAYHLESFDPDFQHLRQSVVPGLTGLWQISSRSDGDLENQKQQDTLYIENWSLWLDMKILIDTVPAVLLAKGAR
jgi:lipopolysaccharide/colanic/teichoic acid biosynthesis glycosyltransferase